MTQQELTQIYDDFTVDLPGSQTLRVLNFQSFKEMVERVEKKAYAEGHQEGVKYISDIVDIGLKGFKL